MPNFKNLKAIFRNIVSEEEESIYRVLPTPELINSEESDDDDHICTIKEKYMEQNQYWSNESQLNNLILIQSAIRRKLVLKKLNQLQDILFTDSILTNITQLQARIRGYIFRKKSVSEKLIIHQSTSEWGIKLQAQCRGYSSRYKIKELNDHYLKHLDVIVWVQRHFRKRYVKPQDKHLVVDNDHDKLSVNTIRTFAHLLNDCDFDFDCELAINELRQQITERIQENNQLYGHINTLDIYIALFIKNATTLEEVMKHSGALKNKKQKILRNLACNSSLQHDPYSLNGIDKASRQRLEYYQNLLYLLQTEPKYLARLLSALTNHQLIGQYTNYASIESTVLSIFSYATNSREEYLLINLCKYCISEEIKTIQYSQDFLRGNYAFMKLILQTNRGVKEREFFKKLIQPLVTSIIENDNLDLETNPINIYKKLINEEEINTGIPTNRPLNVSELEAISYQDVQEKLVMHIGDLKRATEQFLLSITTSVNDVPYGIRIIAREVKHSLENAFPSEPHSRIVKIIGHFLYYRYLNPAIIAPEQYDVINTIVNPVQRKNLAEISKMLHYISSGKTFEDPHLNSLNRYVIEAGERFSDWFIEVTKVEDPQSYFGIDALDDQINTQKPTVYMNSAELFHLHYVLENNMEILQPEVKKKALYLNNNHIDTPLYDLVKAIGPSTYKPNIKLSNESTFPLTLSSHIHDNQSMSTETRLRQTTFDTKRLVVHVIKNQSGHSLEEILQAPVDDQYEKAWEIYKMKEFLNMQSSSPYNGMSTMYSKRRYLRLNGTEALLDLNEISFLQLKQLTHRLLLHLERCNVISAADGYQSMINMIAQDITGKNNMRRQRERELERMKSIIEHLNQKRDYLLDQSNQYEDYFNGCMESMANKKNKKNYKFTLSLFSKQYFHIRSIQRSGNPVPRFGSYKYTAKQLYDRGILVQVDFIGVTSKNYDRIAMVFSMDQPGIISIVAGLDGSKYLPAPASMVVTVDLKYEDLLQIQYEGSQIISLLDDSVKVNLNLLIYFINKK
ncbi:Rho GTPase activation protein [Cunninghamella echinulata]|nr:Rho GTPase activation protein [Cunninghamella echinulata]